MGKDPSHRKALQQGGGRIMSPCLRIERDNQVRWLYESDDIIAYLRQQLAHL